MALRINFNYEAAVTHTALRQNERLMNKSLLRLSTGLRILNASDDSAGLFIADQLALVSAGLEQGNRNIQTGISALQIAENSAGQIYSKLKEIYVKAENAANDINDPNARAALQREINSFVDAIDKIARDTEYNGIKLLDGTFTNKYIHYGPRSGQSINISISSLRASSLGSYTMDVTGDTTASATADLTAVDNNYTYDAATDSITVTIGGDTIVLNTESQMSVRPYSGASPVLDASVIAKTINENSTAQQHGLRATASNTETAGADFGAGLANFGGDGTENVRVVIYVGDSKVFDKTYDAATNPNLDQFIDDINASSLNTSGLLQASKDAGGTKLVLTSANGETISVEVTVTDSDTTTTTTVDLNKIINAGGATTINGSAAGTTGHGVAVGELTLASIEGFSVTTAGTLGALTFGALQFESLNNIDVSTNAGAEKALLIIDGAIKRVDTVRSQIGAVMNNLQSIYDAQKVAKDNTDEAESVIRNVDFAKEMATFTTMQIRMQSGIAMLAQANTLPQLVLQLLR